MNLTVSTGACSIDAWICLVLYGLIELISSQVVNT